MDSKKISLFLKDLRNQKNVSQQDLANALNVTLQTVSKWETGESLPDITMLQALSEYYHLSVDDIIRGERIDSTNKVQSKINWTIARLMGSIVVFLSLFLFYVNENLNIGNWDPFNMTQGVVINARGFNLIFNASRISFFTLGGWIIFLSILALITLFTLETISKYKKQVSFHFINEYEYKLIMKITEITLLSGYGLILLGVLFMRNVQFSMGYFIGLLGAIGLLVINFLEHKKLF